MNRTRAVDLDPAALDACAAAFARTLAPGDVIAVRGELGAGKTTFVRAAVRTLHGADVASSPSFTLWQRYEGTPVVHHLDLYRIADPRDVRELGLEDAFDPSAIVFVEWPDRVPGFLPERRLDVTVHGAGLAPRIVEIARR